MASRSVYCVCGQTYDSERFMIQCDACKDWYHGSCVNIKEHESLDIEKYHCVQCQESYGTSVYREIKNWHRHDYADTQAEGKAVQSGTPMFVKELRTRHFKNGDDIVLRLRGPLLNLPYLIQHGFNFPILVDSKVGLGLQIPSDTFTVSDVLDYIGPDFQLDVIDVTRQDSIKMSMKEWVEYYNCSVRNKVYNVISLEFSKTKLAELVKPPTIVQKLSWVENYWPKTLPDSYDTPRPEVMKYCLMSTEDSYTDFHIDFGGTSVWYHILRGEKLFFLIRPTPANLALYEHWSASTNHSETFFGDQVDACYQLVLTQGQTLFIPTGWIHSVFTPVDSLVFGGNFLSSLNIPLQLQIFEMEKRIKTPEKFKFPKFEAVHWFAAPHILEILRDFNVSKREAQHLIAGVKSLISALKMWSSDSQNHKHDDIPPDINVPRLIKDLQREVRTAEKFSIGKNAATLAKKPPARQRKPKDLNQSMERSEPKPSSQFSVVEEPSNFQFGMSSMNILAQQPQMDPSVHLNVPQITSESVLKNFALSPAMAPHLLNAISMKGGSLADRNELYNLAILAAENSKCKDEMGMSMKNESVYDFVDSDDDNLVVDENPPAKKHRNMELVKMSRNMQDLSSEARQGAIKLRFSFNGKTVDDELSMFKQSLLQNANVNSYVEPPKNATLDDLLMATELAEDADNSINLDEDDLSGGRTSPSTREAIQGMLSISKSAFLFTNQGDGNNQMVIPQQYSMPPTVPPSSSSSMGSLSLAESSVANFSILAKKSSPQARSNSYNLSKPKLARRRYRNEDDDDFEESLKQCHQDSDYIYLGLEASDEEFHVFKPRGKNRRDEAWNPKAKLVPNCPKPERPVREGVRKEAIETGLAAAAAKLATMPPPKRQYLKKKTPTKKKETTSLQHGNAGPSFSSKKPVASDPIKSNKKPKKGFATPKQRLGKILKIHKMLY